MLVRRVLVLAAAVGLLSACGSASASVSEPVPTVGGVGVLPTVPNRSAAPGSSSTSPEDPPTSSGTGDESSTSTSTSVDPPSTTAPPDGAVGERAAGNRVLMIGDSVMASTSRRYSNDMCKALVPLGWKVEVDAEVGRFIDFGTTVLDRRLSAGWDAAVVFLGSNYGGNIGPYASGLTSMVERLAPMPVVLVTVSEFAANRRDVNAVIRDTAEKHANVAVLDWAATTSGSSGLLGGDDLHLTPAGRAALAYNVAGVMGAAPEQPGECLATSFRNDSAGSVETGTTAPRRSVTPTTQPRRTVTTTTTRPPTTGTTSPGTPTTAVTPATSATPTTFGGLGTTQPPKPPVTTQPPATQPPATTQPPVVQPPGP